MLTELIADAMALYNKIDKYMSTTQHDTIYLEAARGAVSLASGNLGSHADVEASAEKAKTADAATPVTDAASSPTPLASQ